MACGDDTPLHLVNYQEPPSVLFSSKLWPDISSRMDIPEGRLLLLLFYLAEQLSLVLVSVLLELFPLLTRTLFCLR